MSDDRGENGVGRTPHVLTEAADIVYSRDDEYGDPEDNFATIAAYWNAYLAASGVEDPAIGPRDVSYMMILLKIARTADGGYDHDTDVDIAGYAETSARIAAGDDQ